jgi:hypothetical protein
MIVSPSGSRSRTPQIRTSSRPRTNADVAFAPGHIRKF